MARWRVIVVLVALQILFGLLYAPAYSYDFVWDDVGAIRDNAFMQTPLLEGIFATQHDHLNPNLRKLQDISTAHESYRPLLFLSYRLDFMVSAQSAAVMHIHNILLASVNIWLVFFLVLLWFRSEPMALLAASIFALHPIQVEAITYISGRGDLLAGMWALVSLFFVFERGAGWPGRARIAASALAFVFSLLSKEAYLGLPFCVFLFFWWQGTLKKRAWDIGALVLTLAVYFVWRSWMLGRSAEGDALSALLQLPGIWLHYLTVALVPANLSIERLHPDYFAVPGFVALAFCGFGFLHARLRASHSSVAAFFVGLLWMLLLIGPSALVVDIHGVPADRYVYLPMVGFAVAATVVVSGIAQKIPRLRRLVFAMMCCVLLAYCVMSLLQRSTWESNKTLYTHAVQVEPKSSMAHHRLGYVYASEGRLPEALALFARAVALDPYNIRSLNNLGVTYLRVGQPERAEVPLRQAIERSDNTSFKAWFNLSDCQLSVGDVVAACASVKQALSINPLYARAQQRWDQQCASDEDKDEPDREE